MLLLDSIVFTGLFIDVTVSWHPVNLKVLLRYDYLLNKVSTVITLDIVLIQTVLLNVVTVVIDVAATDINIMFITIIIMLSITVRSLITSRINLLSHF